MGYSEIDIKKRVAIMEVKKNPTKFKKLVKTIVYGAIAVLVLYIMANGLGLVDSLDFGAGAYYYADIPGFSKYVNGEHFKTQFPMWLHIVLFLLWGGLMYKLWTWLEKKLG